MTNINSMYTIQAVAGSKPKRYVVKLGNLTMTRELSKRDAEQWLALQVGELECDNISLSWSGMNSRQWRI